MMIFLFIDHIIILNEKADWHCSCEPRSLDRLKIAQGGLQWFTTWLSGLGVDLSTGGSQSI